MSSMRPYPSGCGLCIGRPLGYDRGRLPYVGVLRTDPTGHAGFDYPPPPPDIDDPRRVAGEWKRGLGGDMPYKIGKVKGDGWKVTSPHGTKSKGTTKEKAQKQVNLLRGVEHGWKPTGTGKRDRK